MLISIPAFLNVSVKFLKAYCTLDLSGAPLRVLQAALSGLDSELRIPGQLPKCFLHQRFQQYSADDYGPRHRYVLCILLRFQALQDAHPRIRLL